MSESVIHRSNSIRYRRQGFIVVCAMLMAATFKTIVAADAASILSAGDVADSVSEFARSNRFPNKLSFAPGGNGAPVQGVVEYTFEPDVHGYMADVYLRYQPDYACFVAIDVDTGAIINLTSFVKSEEDLDNLVMRSEYPAASVFKIVTAAAGLDMGKVTPATVIPFNGKSTTLYKSQVFNHKNNKWTRKPTFKESFAKSINPVFARLGINQIGSDKLREYAQRFGFDKQLESDFNLPQSHVALPFDDEWQIAEAASGYTTDITLSPIHAAQIAATIVNEGKLVTPYMVKSVTGVYGESLYKTPLVRDQVQVISATAAEQLRSLMQETPRIGSARKSFTGLNRYDVYSDMKIGGKTGSLTGYSPKGRHDWFVGYAEKNGKRVAYASLIVNKEKWYVRSSYVARQFIYNYYTDIANKALEDKKARALIAEQATTEAENKLSNN